MLNMTESISLPVTIISKLTDKGDSASRKITETFSQKYAEHQEVPKVVLEELAAIFKGMNGKFLPDTIIQTDSGICAFCEFLIANGGGLESIYKLTSADVNSFNEFCQASFPIGWQGRYMNFRARLTPVVDILWARVSYGRNHTEGFSIVATAAIREALKKEIDRIRSKLGRLNNDLKLGKVLDIDLSVKYLKAKTIPGFMTATKADIIKTIRHYLPQFPLDKGPRSTKHPKAEINPGVWLIQSMRHDDRLQSTMTLTKHFSDLNGLYDYYFPTVYDATCILMYWAMITGWNREVIESVGSDELNLRFKRNRLMNAWSNDYFVIRGIKTRSQPEDKPKPFTHISDKADDYGLYNVLKDFYELTQTIRFGNNPNEGRCIIMGVQPQSSHTIGYFGPGAKISLFGKFSSFNQTISNTQRFFSKHEIYDDADCANPQVCIKSITWRQIRAGYETILEDMGLPLYVRQMLLGHSSMDTTMFPYGSDKHATKIQMDELGKIISEIHEQYSVAKYFQGAFLTPLNDPRKRENRSQRVVPLAHIDWKDNIIMVCENCRKSNWPGHELYVKEGDECNYLAECLFCCQCLIGKETLPYLAQWDMDIQEYFEEEGDWDSDLKWLELRQAIKEVFELWSKDNNSEDVMWAKATAMRSDFQRIPLDIWHVCNGSYYE
jgi:hypothetical protein